MKVNKETITTLVLTQEVVEVLCQVLSAQTDHKLEGLGLNEKGIKVIDDIYESIRVN